MILRRLAQHLREQNWAAITIEFVLLVAGVFLGLAAGPRSISPSETADSSVQLPVAD